MKDLLFLPFLLCFPLPCLPLFSFLSSSFRRKRKRTSYCWRHLEQTHTQKAPNQFRTMLSRVDYITHKQRSVSKRQTPSNVHKTVSITSFLTPHTIPFSPNSSFCNILSLSFLPLSFLYIPCHFLQSFYLFTVFPSFSFEL